MLPTKVEQFPISIELIESLQKLEIGKRFSWKKSALMAGAYGFACFFSVNLAPIKEGENIQRFGPSNVYLNMRELFYQNDKGPLRTNWACAT